MNIYYMLQYYYFASLKEKILLFCCPHFKIIAIRIFNNANILH